MQTLAEKARKYFDGLKPQMVQDTLDWSAINSGSGNMEGVTRMIGLLRDRLDGLGAETSLVASQPLQVVQDCGEEATICFADNLFASFRPDCEKRLLFTGHADTVFGKEDAFQDSYIDNEGRLRGPGVADMKGGLRILFAALQYILENDLAAGLGFDVAINSDEERGSPGSSAWLQRIAEGHMAGLIVEPAMPDGSLAGARAGSANMSIRISGTSAHAGREFTKGRNAVVAAAEIAASAAALARPDDGLTVNIASIGGGSAPNVVPDNAVIRLNIRGRKSEDLERTVSAIRTLAREAAEKREVTASFYGGIHRPVKEWTGPMRRLFETASAVGIELGLDLTWRDTGGCCDGNNIAAAGVPVIDTLGVVGGNIHSHGEYALPDSFSERATLITCLVDALATVDLNGTGEEE